MTAFWFCATDPSLSPLPILMLFVSFWFLPLPLQSRAWASPFSSILSALLLHVTKFQLIIFVLSATIVLRNQEGQLRKVSRFGIRPLWDWSTCHMDNVKRISIMSDEMINKRYYISKSPTGFMKREELVLGETFWYFGCSWVSYW